MTRVLDDPSPLATRAAIVCLLLAIAIVYLPVAHFEFVNWDDDQYIVENPRVLDGLTADNIRWAFTTTHVANWHPLTWLSHQLDCTLFGARPGAAHLVNVAWHLLNTLLVIRVLRRLGASAGFALAVAALWALHPLRVESVAWVSERKDLLSAAAGLSAVWAYVRYVEAPSARRMAIVAAWQLVSLLCKPMLVTLPVLLLVLDAGPLGRWHGPEWRSRLLEKWPLVTLSAVFCVVAIDAQHAGGALRSVETLTLGARVANAGQAYLVYLAQSVWPIDLACFYPLSPANLLGAAIMLVATLALLCYARRLPRVTSAWLWYVVALVPVIGLVQVGGQAHADRYTYLPQLGVLVASASLAGVWLRSTRLAGLATLAACVALAGLTARQVLVWRDSETLFTHCLAVTGEQSVAHFNLGLHLAAQQRTVEAEEHYRRAIALQPHSPKAHNNLGLLIKERDPSTALTHFRTAVAQQSGYFEGLMNLGQLLEQTGDGPGAIDALRQVVELRPDAPRGHMILGRLLANAGNLSAAESRLQRALELQPREPETLLYLGMVKIRQGDVTAGRRLLEQARDLAGENRAVRELAVRELEKL